MDIEQVVSEINAIVDFRVCILDETQQGMLGFNGSGELSYNLDSKTYRLYTTEQTLYDDISRASKDIKEAVRI